MGRIRRSARRTARRTVRRGAILTTAVVGGTVAAVSAKKRRAADAEKAKASQENQADKNKQEQTAVDPIQKLKETLANGQKTLEEYKQILDQIK